jgi:hypothetical protein
MTIDLVIPILGAEKLNEDSVMQMTLEKVSEQRFCLSSATLHLHQAWAATVFMLHQPCASSLNIKHGFLLHVPVKKQYTTFIPSQCLCFCLSCHQRNIDAGSALKKGMFPFAFFSDGPSQVIFLISCSTHPRH